ncbi:MAG TPA: putative maltokinase [Terriglobia bacterium]|nr:putative maltokinase [Terriglobia bacterium]
MSESFTLDFPDDWQGLERGSTRRQMEQHVLPAYLSRQRWFASKGTNIDRVELVSRFALPGSPGKWLLTIFRVHLADGRSEEYFIPLAAVWNSQSSTPAGAESPEVLASIRDGTRNGTLRDALAESAFVADLVRAVGDKPRIDGAGGSLRFSHTHAYFPLEQEDEWNIRKLGAEQSNSSILVANKMVLKAFRKLERGVQPELEMGRYLTDVANYRNTPPLLGSIEELDDTGQPTALVVIQRYVQNHGDGWSFTLNHLKHFFEEVGGSASDELRNDSYVALMERLGTRIGELQQAFALDTSDPAFGPEPISASDIQVRKQEIRSEAESTFALLANSGAMLSPQLQGRVSALLTQRDRIFDLISSFNPEPDSSLLKTRFHGDLHLGQVLVTGDDFYIIDFEGEPGRSFAQRRAKQSPLKDVAGMLRSLNYAAWSALFEYDAGQTDQLAKLEKSARRWLQASSKAMMQGYRKAAEGCPSYPANPDAFRRMLDLFILERVLYEARYELANRPSWLRIPLEGIINLLAHA